MEFYQFIQTRVNQRLGQLKCFLAFAFIIAPVVTAISWLKPYSFPLFHLLIFLTGWFAWTFIEYILHRFWMHGKGVHANSVTQLHHHHHSHPTEIRVTVKQLSSLVLIAAVILAAGVYFNNYLGLLAGLVWGLAGYLIMHRILHQKWCAKVFSRLFRYHIYHHCKFPNTCFGISVPWWDDFFRTVPSKNVKISPRIIAFYLNEEHHDHLDIL